MSGSDPIFSNPNLLNPLNPQGQTVPTLPGITKPFPVTMLAEAKNYICTMLNHHMHRTDGKRLAFTFGHLETKDAHDIEYLDSEINSGNNPFIRRATPEEVNAFHMRVDPRGTMEKQLTPEIEDRVRAELQIELQKSFEEKLRSVGVQFTEEQMQKFLGNENPGAEATSTTTATTDDPSKIAGLDAIQRLRTNLSTGVQTGTATIYPSSAGGASVLGGIVGSDKTTNFAAEAEGNKAPTDTTET